ncbi:MAG TPA: CHASE3 domain-containing protein [Rhodocyclaceae bacterium]|nr:CHASE3 domain-containing protein [Rhodocyclaceae bacterium]
MPRPFPAAMNTVLPLRDTRARMRLVRHWPVFLVILGVGLLLGLLTIGRLHSEFGVSALRTSQAYNSQIDRLNRLLIVLLDAETGVRGFIASGLNPVYLEPYQQAEQDIGPLLKAISNDYPQGTQDHTEFELLGQLIAVKRQLLAETVRIRRVPTVVPPGETGPGKAYMDQIRLSIAVLRGRLEERNARSIAESTKRFNDTRTLVTVLALGAVGLVLALFAVQQRQTVLRARIAELLERENIALESTVAERTRELSDLASYLTTARELEQARLARELHDELGALLTAAKMDASWLLRSLGAQSTPDIQARFRRLIDTIGSGITIKRRVVSDLRPPLLQGLGLVEALRALSDDLHDEYRVTLQLPGENIDCDEEQALALFRIVQESVTNIRKYARARAIEVGLAVDAGVVRLWVKDDGVGFDPDNPQLNRHGLAGMKHRVQMFEGRFTVTSAPGAGTRIDATMPLRPAAPSAHG